MKLSPIGDRVVLKKLEPEETTSGGIILAASARDDSEVFQVISVGAGEMPVRPGDKVLTVKYAGTEVKQNGEDLTLVRQGDIIAILEQ